MLTTIVMSLVLTCGFAVYFMLSRHRRADRSSTEVVRKEPDFEVPFELDDFTDHYYRPAESTDEAYQWIPHQYKRDPIIWDTNDSAFYDNPKNRTSALRVRRKLRIRHRDRHGAETQRVIDTSRLGETTNGEPMLLAYCHTEMQTRSFRLASMSDCVDLDTGVSIDDPEHYLTEIYERSTQSSCDRVFDQWGDIFRVVAYVCSCSNGVSEAQATVFTQICQQVANDTRIQQSLVEDGLQGLLPMVEDECRIAVSRIGQMSVPLDLISAVEQMIRVTDQQIVRHDMLEFISMRSTNPVPL